MPCSWAMARPKGQMVSSETLVLGLLCKLFCGGQAAETSETKLRSVGKSSLFAAYFIAGEAVNTPARGVFEGEKLLKGWF